MRLCEIALVRLCDNALTFVNRDFYGSATRLCPIPPNRDECCHDGWPEEQTEQAESFQPAQTHGREQRQCQPCPTRPQALDTHPRTMAHIQ